jgi:hypothetical protein
VKVHLPTGDWRKKREIKGDLSKDKHMEM